MSKPFWFNVIQQWKEKGKGLYGVTFPFLVGAVAIDMNKKINEKFITEIFDTMLNKPVKDYYCEVRWCGNIEEPVVSVNRIENAPKVSLKAKYQVEEAISIGCTTDLMNVFHLNCATFDEALDKLISYTHKITKDNKFSKNKGEFTAFTDEDIDFIESVQKLKNT